MQASLEVIARADRAATVLDPVRTRVLERFREPSCAAEVARDLGLPRQRVGHHVRLLLRQRLLQRVGERRRGNFVQQMLQTSARAYVIAPQVLGALNVEPAEIADRFSSAYLLAAAARTIREVSELRALSRERGKRLPTLTLEAEVRFGSAERQAAFAGELTGLLAELVERYHDDSAPDGRRFRFLVSGYPGGAAGTDTASEETTNDVDDR